MSYFESRSEGILLHLHIQPGASKTEFKGLHGQALKIRIHAPPVDGKANEELLRFLAEAFDVPKSSIQILKGESGRQKTLLLRGLTPKDLTRVNDILGFKS